MSKFLDRLHADRPLLYDGGFGSELFSRGIELTNSTLANEEQPDAVVDIHKTYIAAGADLIGTNTFVASELHLEMAGKDPDGSGALTRTATELAHRAVAQQDDLHIRVAEIVHVELAVAVVAVLALAGGGRALAFVVRHPSIVFAAGCLQLWPCAYGCAACPLAGVSPRRATNGGWPCAYLDAPLVRARVSESSDASPGRSHGCGLRLQINVYR